MDYQATPKSIMRPRSLPRRSVQTKAAPTEEEPTGMPNSAAVLALIVGIIIVVMVVLLAIWCCKQGHKQWQQMQNAVTPAPPPTNPRTGQVLIAQNGACTQDSDCRPGLQCFEDKCRTPETVARVLSMAATAAASEQAKCAQLAQKTVPPKAEEVAVPEPEEVQDDAEQMRELMTEANQAGIYDTLRHASAVSEADQDFGY